MYSLQDAPSNIFERVGGDLDHLGYKLVDAQVVHTFQQLVGGGHIAHLGLHCEVYVKAVANHLFEVVAAVGSVKLHLFEFYFGPHFRRDIFAI